MKIFLIPGLGYDCRIFEKLELNSFDIEYINWIEPKENENFHEYAKRLFFKKIKKNEEVVLIGHSLGAMIAQEIATLINVKKIFLISSIKTRKELPFSFRVLKPLKLYKLFTKEISIKTVKYWGKSHGFINKSEQDLFKSMVDLQTNNYLQWALKSLSIWKQPILPKATTLFQIHGTNDKTFSIKLIDNPDKVIEGGSHIMVYKKPQLISQIIIKKL